MERRTFSYFKNIEIGRTTICRDMAAFVQMVVVVVVVVCHDVLMLSAFVPLTGARRGIGAALFVPSL